MRTLLVTSAVSTALLLGACSAQSAAPTQTAHETTTATTTATATQTGTTTTTASPSASASQRRDGNKAVGENDVVRADFAVAELPAVCGIPSGSRLTNGSFGTPGPGPHAKLSESVQPITFDLDGDGAEEGIAVLQCDGAADALLVLGKGGALEGWSDLGQVFGAQQGHATRVVEHTKGALVGFAPIENGQAETEKRGTLSYANGAYSVAPHESTGLTGATLTTEGLGPIEVGMTAQQLMDLGVTQPFRDGCPTGVPTGEAADLGLRFYYDSNARLSAIDVAGPAVKTRMGAQTGMTVEQLKAIYGDQVQPAQRKLSDGELQDVYVLQAGGHELVFNMAQGKVSTITAHANTDQTIERATLPGCKI